MRVEVRDHGRGLPTGDAAALFERFWRAEAGRERGRAGAGLGLAIVAAIVDAHGGTVDAGNAPDGGAMLHGRAARRRRDGAHGSAAGVGVGHQGPRAIKAPWTETRGSMR